MMQNPSDWPKVRELFDAVHGLPEHERTAFLDAAGVDASVRAEVESLLAHARDDTPSDPLRSQPAAGLRASFGRTGERFGAWVIERPLGAGGMGEVFLARRADGSFEGLSAIKVLKRGMDSEAVLERFSRERQVLARLEHPNIARMLDAGISGDGLPYFVMEYVDGQPIDIAVRGLPLEARLRLILQLADAVAYAHRQLLVHRDLKPGNVLVTPSGQVKLLDFGIAKAIDPADADGSATRGSHRPYTPNYASPEQVRGERVGTGTDIYSLGVLLYELLTGVRPTGRGAETPAQAERSVLEETPSRPSTLPENLTDDPQWLATRRRLKGDLDNILLKALEKPAERRYRSVDAMAQDLRRFLDGFPVSARPASRTYVVAKFVGRNRSLVAVAGVAVLAVLAGLAGTAWQGWRAQQSLAVAQARLKDIRALSKDMVVRYGDAVTHLPGGLKLKEQLLTDNLAYLDRLLAEAGDDRAFMAEIAMACARLAEVQVDNGLDSLQRDGDALTNAQRALRLFADSEAAAPSDPMYYVWWSRSYKVHAVTLRTAGKVDNALTELASAEAMLRRALARMPDDRQILAELGSIVFNAGQLMDTIVFANKGRSDEALARFAVAHDIYRRLVDDPGKSTERYADVYQLGTVQGARGIVYMKRNDLQQARTFLESAVKYREQAVAMEPHNMALRHGAAIESNNLGTTCVDLGDAACALAATSSAWRHLDVVQKEDPQNVSLPRGRASIALNHGRALIASGQPEAALGVLKLSEDDLKPRAAAANAPVAVRMRLARTRVAQAEALWKLRRTEDGDKAATRARAALQAIVEKSPQDATAWTSLGELAMLQAGAHPAERARWHHEAQAAYAHAAQLRPLSGIHLAAWQKLGM